MPDRIDRRNAFLYSGKWCEKVYFCVIQSALSGIFQQRSDAPPWREEERASVPRGFGAIARCERTDVRPVSLSGSAARAGRRPGHAHKEPGWMPVAVSCPEWEIFRSKIAELPMNAIWVRRIYLGNAMDVELDSAGRVLVSPELRAAASLTKEVTLLGMGNYLEVWDTVTYSEKEKAAMAQGMPDALKNFTF